MQAYPGTLCHFRKTGRPSKIPQDHIRKLRRWFEESLTGKGSSTDLHLNCIKWFEATSDG